MQLKKVIFFKYSAFKKTGLNPKQINVVELHDCFSANELITYEALGLCAEGEAGKWIDANQNTYGASYIPNNGNSIASTQYGNFGVSSPRPQTLPVSIPQPVLSSYVPSSSYYPTQSQSIVSAPVYNSQWSNSGVIQGGSTASGLPASYIPNTPLNSGSGLSSTYSSSGYTSSTTLGQISNVPYGAQVGSSSTSSQVTSSQNQLIQNLPVSPNTVTY